MSDPAAVRLRIVYEGHSTFFRVAPWSFLLFALALAIAGSLVVGAAFAALGLLASKLLPWRFAVFREGVLLAFAVRGERFYSRYDVAVQVDGGGAVTLLPTRSSRRGYPLTDGILGSRRGELCAALHATGFRFV